ncbi:MAG: DUF3775 domain-containing protein [Alphaproteobacteria bacterium]
MQALSLETVCFLVAKGRQFDAKEGIVEEDPGSNPTDDGMRSALVDYKDDPTELELRQFIDDLNIDQQCELVALAWLGRGDYGAGEWKDAVRMARERHSDHTASYLLSMPLLPDHLEDGLSALGLSCADFERDHL